MRPAGLEAFGPGGLSAQDRDRLIEDHLPLVHHVLGRLPLRLPNTLDREDLFETGVLGLMNASETFNPTKGASFKTYAYVNIRGAILDEVRRHDVVPRSRRDRIREVAKAEMEAEELMGRKPSPEEIAKVAGLSVEQVEDALVNCHGIAVLSLEEPTGDGASSRLMDSIRMPESPNPSDSASKNELLVKLSGAIKELPERERRVIVLYYAEELRLKEIGLILGITESRVSQIHSRALLRMNNALKDRPKSAGMTADQAKRRTRSVKTEQQAVEQSRGATN